MTHSLEFQTINVHTMVLFGMVSILTTFNDRKLNINGNKETVDNNKIFTVTTFTDPTGIVGVTRNKKQQ